jgi:DNA topoisomerase-1
LSLRGGRFGAFVACSNYPECRYTQKFGQGGDQAQSEGPQELGNGILLKTGRFGPYVERGDKRASIPKDVPVEDVRTEVAERLLSLPREIGLHPETGKPITASIGRYGPYLAHDGKYAKLGSTAEVFETGMNAAVAKLADTASGGGRQRGASREPVAVLGKHPASGGEIKVMAGRYGPYVTDGTTNATLPKGMEPKAVTLDEAVKLIDERAAKGPARKGGRKGGRKKR